MPIERRLAGAVLTIDLDAIAQNYRLLRQRAAPAACAAVVKADAYGLGLEVVAPVLAAAGAEIFFVALPEEGIRLRALLPDVRVAVLNGLFADSEEDYVRHRLVPVLNHLGEIERWARRASSAGRPLPAIVHVDTGMNRLGLEARELARLAAEPERLAGLQVLAVMSHLACADVADHPKTAEHHRRFADALARLPPAAASLANSSGIFRGNAYHFDLVRPGCAIYGINPTPERPNPMRTTVRLLARILQVRDVDSLQTVGYGATHQVRCKSKIATISVGYADGYLRSLSNRGAVGVAGRTAPVVGRVSMDMTTIDITDCPPEQAQVGAWVEVVGPQRTPDAVASDAGTIGYEVLTNLGRRHARIYVGGTTGSAA